MDAVKLCGFHPTHSRSLPVPLESRCLYTIHPMVSAWARPVQSRQPCLRPDDTAQPSYCWLYPEIAQMLAWHAGLALVPMQLVNEREKESPKGHERLTLPAGSKRPPCGSTTLSCPPCSFGLVDTTKSGSTIGSPPHWLLIRPRSAASASRYNIAPIRSISSLENIKALGSAAPSSIWE